MRRFAASKIPAARRGLFLL